MSRDSTSSEQRAILPDGWPRPQGYANAVLASGAVLSIAGQIGWNVEQRFETFDLVEQTRQALEHIVALVREAGGEPGALVRMTWYVVDKGEYQARRSEIGKVYREVVGAHYPAMTLVEVKSLLEDDAKVEIEATAVL